MDEASPKGRKGAEPANEFASAASKAARAVAREAAQALKEASAPVGEDAPAAPPAKRSSGGGLPTTRAELLGLHQDLRHRRDSLPLLSEERVDAVIELARIEVQIARVERAMDPPLV